MNRVRKRNLGALLAKAQWGEVIFASGRPDQGTADVVRQAGRPPFQVSERFADNKLDLI